MIYPFNENFNVIRYFLKNISPCTDFTPDECGRGTNIDSCTLRRVRAAHVLILLTVPDEKDVCQQVCYVTSALKKLTWDLELSIRLK
jgi:hypothetical protein